METLLKEARADLEIDADVWADVKAITARDFRIKKLAAAARSGKPIIDINRLILAGGVTVVKGKGWPTPKISWPNLAMARSTADKVIATKARGRNELQFISNNNMTVLRLEKWPMQSFRAVSTTPIVPPHIREAVPGWEKDNKYIVWEATWTALDLPPRPQPLDPILITHVEGSIFVVEAEWDMTVLEAYVSSL